jgi:hypothetical protein
LNQNFSQTISFRCDPEDIKKIMGMMADWDELQADNDIMGYMGTHLLADRDNPGHYVVVAEFGSFDPEISAYDEAMRNNDRPETQEFAAKMREITQGEPVFNNYDEVYRTGQGASAF